MTRELTGRHVAAILLALFGTVFAVNGFFAYAAVTGFPGIEADRPYRKGVAFNRQIARAETLRALGWGLTATRSALGVLTLRFTDGAGAPLPVTDVAATLFHPAAAREDAALVIAPATPGAVSAILDAPVTGRRELRVTARGPGGRKIEFRRTLWLD